MITEFWTYSKDLAVQTEKGLEVLYLLLEVAWIGQKQKFSTGPERTQLIFHSPLLLGSSHEEIKEFRSAKSQAS